MRRVLVLTSALGAACTLTTSLEGYAGYGPPNEPDAASEAGSDEGARLGAAGAATTLTLTIP